ncbi:MAG: hypothetical protein K0Q50_911 [Vampirovibrio sp.]|jgi:hypothetical protein|nr:hypothetical protein [Vampirovibrio sp.]
MIHPLPFQNVRPLSVRGQTIASAYPIAKKRPNNAEPNNVGKDTVRFGAETLDPSTSPQTLSEAARIAAHNRALPLSHAERLQKTEKGALELFRQYRNKPKQLMQYLQDVWQVEVRSSADHPWVDEALKQFPANGLFQIPLSLLYAKPNPSQAQSASHDESPDETEYDRFLQDLEKKGKVCLLIQSDHENRLTLQHETFHLLQYMNGLRAEPEQLEQSDAATEFRRNMNRYMNKKVTQLATGAFMGKYCSWLQWAGLIDEKPNGVGKAVRMQMQHELDTVRFLKQHGKELGASRVDLIENWMLEKYYQTIYDLSWTLDIDPPEYQQTAGN